MDRAKRTRWSEAETERLRHLASVGISRADAARRMARHSRTVRRRIEAGGIDWREPHGSGRPAVRRLRIDPLDGIRGLALLAVLAYHVAPATVRGGFLGVDVFFVLSGFLLCSLLIEEWARTGRIDKRAYAGRRVRRILPALATLLVALVVFIPILAPDDTYRLPADVVWSAAGLTNWHLVADGTSYFAHLGRQPFVRHLWSIAIEVQFYVVCPFLVAWLVRRHRSIAIGALAVGIALSAAAMGFLYASPDPSRAYFGTDARVGALLVGALVAVLTAGGGSTRRLRLWSARLKSSPWAPVVAGVALLFLVALVLTADERSRALYPAGFLLTQLATVAVILVALRPGRLATALQFRPLLWLGRRSYGIYLWSWPVVVLSRPGLSARWYPAAVAVGVVAPLVLGALSYRFIELPWMRPAQARPRLGLRLRQSPAFRLAAFGVGAAALTGMAVSVPAHDPVADSLVAGQRVLNSQQVGVSSPLTLRALAPTPSSSPAPANPPTLAPRMPTLAPVVPTGNEAVTAIGDSVMLGAAGALKAKFGPAGYIDAQPNRQFAAGIAVAQGLAQQGHLGRVVIMDLGNNGPVQASDFDAFMHNIPAGRVLFVTVRVDQSWQGGVNQTLAASAARYPSARVVDWFGYSEGHPEWFWDDGTHLRPEGADAFANMIASAIASG